MMKLFGSSPSTVNAIYLSVQEPEELITFGVNYRLFVQLDNFRKTATSSNAILWMKGNSCLRPSCFPIGVVLPGEKKTVQLEHNWDGKEQLSFQTLVGEVIYELTENGKSTFTQPVTLPIYNYCGSLTQYRPSERSGAKYVNILIFGANGSGKSSFVITLSTALSKQRHINYGMTVLAGGAAHGTVGLKKFALTQNDEFGIRVWDSWGLTPANYKAGELLDMAAGNLPHGWLMEPSAAGQQPKNRAGGKRAKANAIHALIVFIPISSTRSESRISELRTLVDDAKKYNLMPIYVLARADEEIPPKDKDAFRRNPNDAPHKEFQDAKEAATKALGIGKGNIVLGCPYVHEKEKSFEIDRLACITLELALHSAASNLGFVNVDPEPVSDPDDAEAKPLEPEHKEPPSASQEKTVKERLAELQELKKADLITEEEFTAQKQRVLARLH